MATCLQLFFFRLQLVGVFQMYGYFTPEYVSIREDGGAKHGDGMVETTLQGLDFWYGLSQTLPGEANAIHCNVTTSPNATEPLKFIRTATAQEVAGW